MKKHLKLLTFLVLFIFCLIFTLQLPLKTVSFSPSALITPTKPKLAVATLVKNQSFYLVEWIEFHSMLGFDLFIIYDHGSRDNTVEVLKKYIESGLVLYYNSKSPLSCRMWRSPRKTHSSRMPKKSIYGVTRIRKESFSMVWHI